MSGFSRFAMLAACLVFLAPLGASQDFAAYRGFGFGTSLEFVAGRTKTDAGSVKTLHTDPDLIQTLQWNRDDYFASFAETDPVRNLRFDFHNDRLFKIVATYGRRQVEGMTADDLIQAISRVYGPSTTPEERIDVSAYTGYADLQNVLARWEDEEVAYSLFRSSYGGEFGLIVTSKTLQTQAAASIREAERLKVLAAPQREAERLRQQGADREASEERARALNIPNFRP